MHKFYEEIINCGGDFLERLNAYPNVTLFAPSNAAFNDLTIQPYLSNRTYIRSLLDLHIVNRRLSLDDIDSESVNKVSWFKTFSVSCGIWFLFHSRRLKTQYTVTCLLCPSTITQLTIQLTVPSFFFLLSQLYRSKS